MPEAVLQFFAVLCSWDWAAIVQSVAAVWVAFVATNALQTWKHQAKAQRKSEFLDELIDSIHEFMSAIGGPVSKLRFSKIGMQSYGHSMKQGVDDNLAEAIDYINRRGTEDSEQLFKLLDVCRQSRRRISSLAAKGHVLGFQNYTKCANSSAMITSQFECIQAVAGFIAHPSYNWENTEIRRLLDKILAIDPDEIERLLEENHREILLFAQENYAQMFGK